MPQRFNSRSLKHLDRFIREVKKDKNKCILDDIIKSEVTLDNILPQIEKAVIQGRNKVEVIINCGYTRNNFDKIKFALQTILMSFRVYLLNGKNEYIKICISWEDKF